MSRPRPARAGWRPRPAAAGLLLLALLGACALLPGEQAPASSAERPQLAPAEAARLRLADYLAAGPSPWQPAPIDAAAPADFTVAADGSGSHRSLQAAIDAVPARSPGARRYTLRLAPGVYRETVCIRDKAPLTLLGDPADASAVQIVEGRYHALPKRPGLDAAHPCIPELAADRHGTPGSATLVIASEEVQLAHLTVANDAMAGVRGGIGYPPGAGESGGAQGVALAVQADRVLLEQVRLIGHQDTFLARRPAPGEAARVLVRRSLIAGDVDFVFGNATLVIDDSTLHSRGGRRTPGNGGHVLAPSTPAGERFGFLVQRSRFVAEPGVAAGSVSLGRAWDEGVARGAWLPGRSPNGQALVRDSLLGPHIGPAAAPWAASTSRRPASGQGPQAHRLAEYRNTVLGGHHHPAAREVLAVDDGWASAAGGTTGGALARPGDVRAVRSRAELVAALQPHAGPLQRPRIVEVFGRIDLSTDDTGRALGAEDYRDPAYDEAAFDRAHDPATRGRGAPAGPLEEARRRSAARQAAQVLLRVPSHTTLIGAEPGAALLHGGLLIDQAENVIVRHLRLSDAQDHFPAWEPNDNAHGEWNAQFDNLMLRGARRVWIDHCRFDDGDAARRPPRQRLGRPLQQHDGLLDIVRGSDLVTVSWNQFFDHDKTTLVGSSDQLASDEGRLRVSFHHNHYEAVRERTPRVRFGRVHVYNNLFVARDEGPYRYGYSIGIGRGSRIVSEHNAWETPPGIGAERLLRPLGGEVFVDRGSWHNGAPVDLLAALQRVRPASPLSPAVGWQPHRVGPMHPASEVAAVVRAGAGPGRP